MGKKGAQKKHPHELHVGMSSPGSPKRDGESVDPPSQVQPDPVADDAAAVLHSPVLGMSVKDDPARAEGDDGGDTRDCSASRIAAPPSPTLEDEAPGEDISGTQVVLADDVPPPAGGDEDVVAANGMQSEENDAETDVLSSDNGAPDPPLHFSHTANTLHVLSAELEECGSDIQDRVEAEAAPSARTPIVDADPLSARPTAVETLGPASYDDTTTTSQQQEHQQVTATSTIEGTALDEEPQPQSNDGAVISPGEENGTSQAQESEFVAAAPSHHDDIPVQEVSDSSNRTAATASLAEVHALDSLRNYLDSRMDRMHVNLIDLETSIRDTSLALQHVVETHPSQWTAIVAQSEERQHETTARLLHESTEFAQARAGEVYDSLAGALRDVQASLRQSAEQDVERCRSELMFLLNELAAGAVAEKEVARVHAEQVKQEFATLASQIRQLSQNLETALKMELLPPAAPLPTGGVKMRLVVTIDVPNRTSASNTVLLPITSLATVGMLKREVLRRSLQQQIIPFAYRECFVYSATVVVLDDVVLFEEDTLEDVGVLGNDKLVIRLADPSCTIANPSNANVALDSAPPAPTLSPRSQTSVAANAPGVPAAVSRDGNAGLTALSSSLAGGSVTTAPTEPAAVLVAVFLNENDAAKLDEQESMDRRLTAELARMELDAARREEGLRRTAILKAQAEKLRTTLLDRATYSHNEFERRAARGALEKLNNSMERGATPSVLLESIAAAKQAIASLTATVGEDDRVAMLNAAMASERNRKARLIEDLKDFIFTVRHRLRIPAELYVRAEEIVFAADRAILLEPTITVKEVDEVHRNFSDFVASLKK